MLLALEAIADPPAIVLQAKPQRQVVSQEAIFWVIATGAPPLKYQWLKAGMELPGATNGFVSFHHVTFADAAKYSVIVSNAEGSATSKEAELVVDAPQAGDIDGSFNSSDPSRDLVSAIGLEASGKVLIAQHPTGPLAFDINRLTPEGDKELSWVDGPHGMVTAIVPLSDGRTLVAGAGAGCRVCSGGPAWTGFFRRLRADGTLDPDFRGIQSPGLDQVVQAGPIALQPDGKAIVGGQFEAVQGEACTNIARFNADGTLDQSFRPALLGGDIERVLCLALQPDGKVLVGGVGVFSRVGNLAQSGIARLNPDGSLDRDFLQALPGFGGSPYAAVDSIVLQPDGKVLVGGYFSAVNGTNRSSLAKLNPDGSLDESFVTGVSGPSAEVNCIALQKDGKVLIGGYFQAVNDVGRYGIARLNPDGTLDHSFLENRERAEPRVVSIAVQPDGRILLGGYFAWMNGSPVTGLVRLWGSSNVPPVIQRIYRTKSATTVTWDALPGRTYRLQFSKDLETGIWTTVPGDVLGSSDGAASKEHKVAGEPGQQFYRVLLTP